MSTRTITIGVPVYNGAALFDEALACLAAQTRGDFVALISDNGSDDATPEIAQRFAARDSRFIHLRREDTIPPAENFASLLTRADTPFFLWRAHDDLSSETYLETLGSALEAAPDAMLAAPRVESLRLSPSGETRKRRVTPFEISQGPDRLSRLSLNLHHLHQSWFYGLWRREEIAGLWDKLYTAYPHAWASDFLLLFGALAADGVVGSDATVFTQRIMAKAGQHASQRDVREVKAMQEQRADFARLCKAELDIGTFGRVQRLRAERIVQRFTSRCVYSRTRILKARLGIG